jgi:hypothetical protein
MGQQPIVEKELMEIVYVNLADSLIDKYTDGFTKLDLKIAPEDNTLQKLESVFKERCSVRSIDIQNENPDMLFIFTGLTSDTLYSESEKGIDFVERTIKITLDGWLEDYAQERKIALKLSQNMTDTVEQDQWINTKSPLNEDEERSDGTWKIIIEPIIVIGSVTVIIYLFFSQRS